MDKQSRGIRGIAICGAVAATLAFAGSAQAAQTGTSVYSGAPVAIPDAGAEVYAPISVSGFLPGSQVADVNVRIGGTSCNTTAGSPTVGIDHTWDSDLVIRLIAPNGTAVTIINRAGGSENNFCQVLLDDDATGSPNVQTGSAPFTGTWRPANAMTAFNGINPNGTWKLGVQDVVGGDTGKIRAWSIRIEADNAAPDDSTYDGPPKDSAKNGANTTITGTASDDRGVTSVRVRLTRDDSVTGPSFTHVYTASCPGCGPYSSFVNWSFNTTGLSPTPPNGAYFTQIIATDEVGRTSTTTGPALTIVNP